MEMSLHPQAEPVDVERWFVSVRPAKPFDTNKHLLDLYYHTMRSVTASEGALLLQFVADKCCVSLYDGYEHCDKTLCVDILAREPERVTIGICVCCQRHRPGAVCV